MEGLGGPVNLDRYTTSGIDPALEDCCRREVVSNRKHNALTATLRRHDVSALAERRRKHLVAVGGHGGHSCRCSHDPNTDGGEYRALTEYKQERLKTTAQQQQQQQEDEQEPPERSNDDDDNSDDDDDDSEFDYLLDEDFGFENDETIRQLEDQRRVELEYQLLMRELAGYHGYGVHRQVHPNRVLKLAGLGRNSSANHNVPPPPQAVVLHLLDPDSLSSASLDYFLETNLGREFAGTMFLRSGGRSTLLMDPDLAQKSLPSSVLESSAMPCLVAIRDGVVVAVCPKLYGLVFEEDGEIEPRAVRQCLDHANVLIREPPMDDVCLIRPEEEAHMDFMLSKMQQVPDPEPEQHYNCGVAGCRKSFHHEHVGIKTEEQDGLVVKEDAVVGTNEWCQFIE